MIPKECKTPAFCEDKDDFHKLFFSLVMVSSENAEDAVATVCSLRGLLHDYLALVLSGKMNPYVISKREREVNKEDFRDLISEMNLSLMDSGVPLKEQKDGKVGIDYEALEKLMGERDGKA